MKIVELKNKLAGIESEISTLTNQRIVIQNELRQAEDDLYMTTFLKWGIDVGTKMIWIDKHTGYYLLRTFTVTNVDLDRLYFRAIIGDYYAEFSEEHFSTKKDWMSFSSLIPAEQAYNIYFVDDETLDVLQKSLCSLQITRENLKQFEDALNLVSKCSIKK